MSNEDASDTTDRSAAITAAATAGSYGLILLVMFLLLFVVPFGVFLLL